MLNIPIKKSILWTNSSPLDSFSGQEIMLPANNYDVIEIFYYVRISPKQIQSVKFPLGEIALLPAIFQYQDHGNVGSRAVEFKNQNKVKFYDAVSVIVNDALSRQSVNNWCIPLYIIGHITK